ncbi:hypothetical protein RLEG3_23615 [Rhizobium leguminosarum bv. trifolii WSM1689]|nr:hypothetical protein RLEG3_23615 [Rhizobium leguminosarum bv. trifolii WSM1689]
MLSTVDESGARCGDKGRRGSPGNPHACRADPAFDAARR